MIINTNIAALNTIRQLGINEKNTQSALSKLSSGLRINSAADDAAGLAISEKMRGQISGLNQASSNAQNGINMVSTAEGALNETTSILQRMRELAVQASNDTNTTDDRTAMQTEMNQLTSEINRIGNTTEFNTQKLLKGTNQTAVTTAAANTTITAGETGVATGTTSALSTVAKSVVGVVSSAAVQGLTSTATGAVGDYVQNTPSVKGQEASVTLANGITFSIDDSKVSLDNAETMNGRTITIQQGTTAGATSSVEYDAAAKTYTFTIGENTDGSSRASNRGELFNEISSALTNYSGSQSAEVAKLQVNVPQGTSTTLANIATSGQLVGGVNEQKGSYSFDINDAFKETGDTITVGGKSFAVSTVKSSITGNAADSTTDLAAVSGTLKVNVGGTDYTINQAALQTHTAGNKTDADLVSLLNNASDGGSGKLSDVANVSIDSTSHKITITTKSPDQQQITFSATGTDAATIQTAFGLNDASITGGSAPSVTAQNMQGVDAVFDTGAITAGSGAAVAGTFVFNGVTLNLTFDDSKDSTQTSTSGTIGTNTLSWTIGTKSGTGDTTPAAQAQDLVNALNYFKNNAGTGNALANYSFSLDTAGTGVKITSSQTGVSTAAVTVSGGTSFAIANAGSANQQSNGDGVTGVDTIGDSTSVVINVDGTDFTADSTALKAEFAGSAPAAGDIATWLGANAKDVNGNTLSSMADVTTSGGNLQITAKTGAGATATSTVSVAFNGAAADKTKVANALGLASGQNATGATVHSQVTDLAEAINSDSDLGAHYQVTISGKQLTLTEKTNAATGTALAGPTVAGSGTDNKLIITDGNGRNLKTVTITQNTSDALNVTADANGNLTIALANTNASNNTAAKIEAAIQSQGTAGGVDFSKYTVKSTGDWDTTETGSDITKGTSTLVGGTQEVKGTYTMDVTKPFAAGDVVTIKGQTFTAVDGTADSTKGQFSTGNGTAQAQASSLIDAINLNSSLMGTYNASASGSTITLTEINATGTDLKTTDLAVAATGTQGQYTVNASQLLTDGASFSIDGQNISVSSKTANVGYANGTAIQETSDSATQTSELADAINKNSTLSQKYTASVGSDGNLLLTQKIGNSDAPSVQMTSSTKGDFQAKLQIGANSGQTMTVNIGDMRSISLGISGDGSASTVEAKDGSVASYTAIATVNNGTDNTNVEFALDISTADKATAAISVIDDATSAVSAERSNLGAYQNRLEHTINNLGTASQNITTAEANIRDVDMATEMTEFQKNNILQQAAQAMLAQANQQPQGVLQLLR